MLLEKTTITPQFMSGGEKCYRGPVWYSSHFLERWIERDVGDLERFTKFVKTGGLFSMCKTSEDGSNHLLYYSERREWFVIILGTKIEPSRFRTVLTPDIYSTQYNAVNLSPNLPMALSHFYGKKLVVPLGSSSIRFTLSFAGLKFNPCTRLTSLVDLTDVDDIDALKADPSILLINKPAILATLEPSFSDFSFTPGTSVSKVEMTIKAFGEDTSFDMTSVFLKTGMLLEMQNWVRDRYDTERVFKKLKPKVHVTKESVLTPMGIVEVGRPYPYRRDDLVANEAERLAYERLWRVWENNDLDTIKTLQCSFLTGDQISFVADIGTCSLTKVPVKPYAGNAPSSLKSLKSKAFEYKSLPNVSEQACLGIKSSKTDHTLSLAALRALVLFTNGNVYK